MSSAVYGEVRTTVKTLLEAIIRDIVLYTEHAKRKTVTVLDVVHALNRRGTPIAGFGP
jgi:histone H4